MRQRCLGGAEGIRARGRARDVTPTSAGKVTMLDAQTAAIVAAAPRRLGPPSIAEERASLEHRAADMRAGALCGGENRVISHGSARIPIRIYSPVAHRGGVVVYVHGGGWALGSLDSFDPLASALCDVTGCVVVAAGYRLAPEYPYPSALQDIQAVTDWAYSAYVRTGHRGRPFVIVGDSAGGNLAAVVARWDARAPHPRLDLQVLAYPVTDCATDTDSYRNPENQLLLTRERMKWFWQMYAPDPGLRMLPDLSPLRAGDLSGLPPTLIMTAEHDVLRDEGEEYARRLQAAGVSVDLMRFNGQAHGFLSRIGVLPSSETALRLIERRVTMIRAAPKSRPPGRIGYGE
jgi:acetyl esterase